MKSINTIIACFFVLHLQAQNVGIGSQTPGSKLEIKTNSSVLYPQLTLLEDEDDYARLNFANTLKPDSLWTIAVRPGNTINVGRMNFYYRQNGDLMSLTSEGDLGIGVFDPTAKLDLNGDFNLRGPMRLNGNAGAAGQVLTSTGSGAPQWTNLAAPNIRFSADFSNLAINSSSVEAMTFESADYNTSPTDITIGADYITLKEPGLYHLEFTFNFFSFNPSTLQLDFYLEDIMPDGSDLYLLYKDIEEGNSNENYHFSIEVYSNANNTFYPRVRAIGGSGLVGALQKGSVRGHLISN